MESADDAVVGTDGATAVTTATQVCKTCKQTLPMDAYETFKLKNRVGYNKECRRCRAERRKAKAKAAPAVDPASVELPKACVTCGKGPGEVSFQFRKDLLGGGYRTKCIACMNKDHVVIDAAYRKRKAEQEGAAFQERRTAMHREWIQANPERARDYQRRRQVIVDQKFKYFLTYTKGAGIEVKAGDEEVLRNKLLDPCHYCGYQPPEGEPLNGLDRLDCKGIFCEANTVACCAVCNQMKLVYSVDGFVHQVRCIARHSCQGMELPVDEPVTLPRAMGGHTDRREAVKAKDDYLSVDEKMMLWSAPCYLCGRTPALGIDRKEAKGDYRIDNVAPCCFICNYMKKDLTLEELKMHVVRVGAHTCTWDIRPSYDLITNAGKKMVPIGVYDDHGTLVMAFPSEYKAAVVTNHNVSSIHAALMGDAFKGYRWCKIDDALFMQSTFSVEAVRDFLKVVRRDGAIRSRNSAG